MSGNPWTPGPWLYQGFIDAGNTSGWYVVVAPHRVISVEGRSEEEADANARLIAAAPEMAEALEALEDAASCLAATFERIPEDYPERSAIHTHEGHTETYLLDQIKAARALLARIRGETP